MVILGVDPGTATVGYGVIRRFSQGEQKGEIKNLDYGVIKTSSSLAPAERLKEIHSAFLELIKNWRPDIIAVEKLYFFKNLKTAFPVSQAKGVILLATAQEKVPVFEITPLQIKMALTSYGRASKRQVQEMVKVLLSLEKIPKPDDASDALGAAICCARAVAFKNKISSLTKHFSKV